MNKKFTKLMAALALLVFMAPNMVGWGQTRDEVTTTFKDKTSGTWTAGMTLPCENGGLDWVTSGKPNSFDTQNGRGIQWSKESTNLTTTITNASVTKVVVVASTNANANANSLSVYVGENQIGSTQNMPKENNVTYTFEATTGQSGEIKVSMYNDGTKSTYVKSITVTYTTGGPALEDNDLALTGAPVALEFDLYNNSTAQVINYTTSSTGAITVSASDYVTTQVNETAKTITVTPTAVTPSIQTITVSQAADDTYAAGSATFTVEVTDNSPTTTVDIDATGITNTDVYVGTAAGSLSATVTSGGSAVSGATVTWSGDNDAVATIASDGTVTLVGAGTVNFTATYAGAAGQYMPSSATYEMIVTSSSPEIEIEIDLNNTFFGCEAFTNWTSDYETSYNGTKDGVTITLDKADGQHMYINNNGIRMYDGNTLTFDAPDGYTIIQIELEGASGFSDNLEADGLEDGTWTGSATQVVITGNTNKKNMTKATVTLAPIGTEPFITVASNLIEVDYNGGEGTLDLTYENLTIGDMTDFGIQYYDAEGVATETPDWIDDLLVAEQDPSIGEGYVVSYVVTENEGNARSAYFKVYALDDEAEMVYSNLVTINQAGGVMYDYSNNGEIGNDGLAGQGTTITLAEGTNLNDTFVFAGWTTNPNDVSELLTEYTFADNDTPVTFYAVYAHTTIVGGTSGAKDGEAGYVKVTDDAGFGEGDYLIVYENSETEAYIFDGQSGSDKYVTGTINNGIISSLPQDAAVVTIVEYENGYSIQISTDATNNAGKYIGGTSGSNTMNFNATSAYENLISFDSDGNADIECNTSHLCWNPATTNGHLFRYYKSSSYSSMESIQLYKYTAGGTPTPQPVTTTAYYTRVFLNETVEEDIDITGPSIIPSGSVLDMGEDYVLTNDLGVTRLVIEDGGQLYSVLGVDATAQKNITGRENGGGWNFITSPIFAVEMDPATAGMTTGNYDLYRFNPSVEPAANGNTYEWENYKSHGSDFTVEGGHGYLYANLNDVVLQFSGVVNNDETVVSYEYNEESASEWKEWHLVGNPYMYEAYVDRDYYVIGIDPETDKSIIVASEGGTIAPCEGIMIQGTDGSVSFTKDEPTPTDEGRLQMTVAQQVVTRDGVSTGSTTIDNAIVSFNEGSRLGKFYFGENDANIYIPQNGKEYAIVSTEAQGEMPVNFRAANNGTYTLSINPEGVEMNYLHLIDNMTGANIDLLQTPTYTFNAKTTDYESRFRLVFVAGASTGSAADETFAFFANGELIVSNEGEATLQVVDMTGRILSSQSLNGNGSVKVNAPVGVYVLRLINGNEVKTQKIVVR